MKMISYLKERWGYFKAFLRVSKNRLLRDKVDFYMLIAAVIIFIVSAYTGFGFNISPFVGVLIVWGFSLIFRLGSAEELGKEWRDKFNKLNK